MPPMRLYIASKWKVKSRRIRYCTTMPETKATATEIRMPEMIVRALAVLMKSTTEVKLPLSE